MISSWRSSRSRRAEIVELSIDVVGRGLHDPEPRGVLARKGFGRRVRQLREQELVDETVDERQWVQVRDRLRPMRLLCPTARHVEREQGFRHDMRARSDGEVGVDQADALDPPLAADERYPLGQAQRHFIHAAHLRWHLAGPRKGIVTLGGQQRGPRSDHEQVVPWLALRGSHVEHALVEGADEAVLRAKRDDHAGAHRDIARAGGSLGHPHCARQRLPYDLGVLANRVQDCMGLLNPRRGDGAQGAHDLAQLRESLDAGLQLRKTLHDQLFRAGADAAARVRNHASN